jgi:hypothetical protein
VVVHKISRLHPTYPMLKRSFPYLSLVVAGMAGLWLWKESRPKSHKEEVSNTRHSSPPLRRAVPPATRLDFLTDLGQPYQVRINLLHSTLASECSEPEIRYLYQQLAQGAATAEIPEHGYVIANDIMTQLLRHETDPQRFATNFTALLKDSHQPEVIRDYAVQSLASWLTPRAAEAGALVLAAPSPEITSQVLKSLVMAATDPALGQTSIPGTTLMMLVDLTRSDSGVDCRASIATLKPWLGKALSEGSTLSLAIRVSAVVAAGILAPEDFRPALRNIAYQPDGGGALQLPALASLGQSGEAADVSKLQHVAATQPTLAYAASDACRVLTARLTGESPEISQ